MKHLSTHFKPIATIEFTKEEIELAMNCARHHYEGACHSAGEAGGFLFGAKNRIEHFDQPETLLEFRDLDTLAKILEMPASALESYGEQLKRQSLQLGVRAILRKLINDTLEKINY